MKHLPQTHRGPRERGAREKRVAANDKWGVYCEDVDAPKGDIQARTMHWLGGGGHGLTRGDVIGAR